MTVRWRRLWSVVSLLAIMFALANATVPVEASQVSSKLLATEATVGDADVLDFLADSLASAAEGGFLGTVGGLVISTGPGAVLGGLGGFLGGFFWGAATHVMEVAELTGPSVRHKVPARAFD